MAEPDIEPAANGPAPPTSEPAAPTGNSAHTFSAVTRWLEARESRPTWRTRCRTLLVRMHAPLVWAAMQRGGRFVLASILRQPRRWAVGSGGGLSGLAMMWMVWSWPGSPPAAPTEQDVTHLEQVQCSEIAPSISEDTAGLSEMPRLTAPTIASAGLQIQPALPSTDGGRTTTDPGPFYLPSDTFPTEGEVRQVGFAAHDPVPYESAPNNHSAAAWLIGTIEDADDVPAREHPSFAPADVATHPAARPEMHSNARHEIRPVGGTGEFVPPPYVPSRSSNIAPVRRNPRTTPGHAANEGGPVIRPGTPGQGQIVVQPR